MMKFVPQQPDKKMMRAMLHVNLGMFAVFVGVVRALPLVIDAAKHAASQ